MATPSTILIVGGGLTGLATAALLRAKGAETCVLEAQPQTGGRHRPFEKDGVKLDTPWSVARTDSPVAKAWLDMGLAAPAATRLRPYCLTSEGAGPVETGTVAFVVKSKVGSLSTRLALRGTLGKTTRKEDRLDQFYIAESAGGDFAEILDAWAGPAAAEPGTMPSAAFALAREVILERRAVTAYEPGFDAWVRQWTEAAGEVRCGVKAERVLVEDGFARGVKLDGGEDVSAKAVVLAMPPSAARRLFTDEDWGRVAGDERLLWESSLPRSGVVMGLTLERPLSEPFFAFMSRPCAFAVGVGAAVTVDIGLPIGDPPAEARQAELAEEARAALVQIAPGAAKAKMAFAFREVDEAWAALAGGRHRPPVAVGGIEGLYIAGDGTNAPHFGLDRMLESARQVARLSLS
jgi:glycine/D-amino acid oxidase-like deaminating enzyme